MRNYQVWSDRGETIGNAIEADGIRMKYEGEVCWVEIFRGSEILGIAFVADGQSVLEEQESEEDEEE